MEYILSFIVVVGVIILVHELGHFLAARAVGIRVERFSIGFGPKLVAFQRGETEYRVSWLPLGGYVKMAGMIDESLDASEPFDPNDPHLFMNKNGWQKVLVISAGVIMNIVLAGFVLWLVFGVRGIPTLPENVGTVIDRPVSGWPADKAGLERGDEILSIDGVAVERWEDLVDAIYKRPGQEVRIDIERAGERKEIVLTTRSEKEGSAQIGKIGIQPMLHLERVGVGQAFVYGWTAAWTYLKMTAIGIGRLVTLQASVRDLSGPVGIAKMSGEYARQGIWDLLDFIALISVNIGFVNILPIPALDGGHLVLILIEAVRRRPLSTKLKLWVQQVGMVLLLALIAVVVFNDFMKLR